MSENNYPAWYKRERILSKIVELPEDTLWNIFICVTALAAIVWTALERVDPVLTILDVAYDIMYAIHILGIAYEVYVNEILEKYHVAMSSKVGFLLDVLSYAQCFYMQSTDLKIGCYYLRLHRSFRYLWDLNDYNLKGSVLGTTLKYCYVFMVLRVTWALVWLHVDKFESQYQSRRALYQLMQSKAHVDVLDPTSSRFLTAIYIVNKMFIPIGPSIPPKNDIERITCMLIMLTGCLVVTGIAVASLSLVISIYLRPEETFRARYRLIIKEMQESHVPITLREKVKTFYKMYWHKQRAVSATQLLPSFPPFLPSTVYTDIYFEATQRSRILCDLSYQFLSEVVKKMVTTHYIPGDAIIKRSSRKSSIIYITYGDIEMLTAEDDNTAILRMTRGTVLSSCGGCPPACGRAYVQIRAATFCTTHQLTAVDLWRVAVRHGRTNGQALTILGAFYDHLEKVKRHYTFKVPEEVKYKSSILHFKRNLLALTETKDANGEQILARTDFFLELAGCYIMRNRPDASLIDESDAICLRPTFPCILQPTSSLQLVWHSFVACLIVTVCLTHPYYLVFKKEAPLEFRFFDYVVTVIYILDIIVHLSTGDNVEEGVAITFAQTSSQQMRSHWFILDVIGTAPIFEFIGDGHFAGINKLLRLHKVFRVLKNIEEMCVYHSNVLRFLSYTLLLLIACYLIATLQQAFMCFKLDYCLVTNFTHSPFWSEKPLDDDTVEDRLMFGLYWAISMITFTAHMETWNKETWDNVLYTMFVLEICIVLRIFMEAVYSATIMVTTSLREDYDSCIARVKSFLIRKNIDPILRQRFITYLQLCWYTGKAYNMTNKRSVFYDLPPHVYQDIVARQRIKYILCIPFMKFLYEQDLKDVSSKARAFYTSPNEILMNTGDICNEIYVITQGMCEILSPDTQSIVGTLGSRSHFGVLECLLRIPVYYTVRAVTHVQVFSISRKHLCKAVEIPQIKHSIDFAKKQAEYTQLQSRRDSFLLYVPLPSPPNRERFRLPRKHEKDTAFLQPFQRLGFLAILRYVFPRYTIRPDGIYLIRYEWFRASCAFLSAIIYPSYSYLVLQYSWLYFITLLLDFSAYFDIFQRMLVGYYNERGVLVYHPFSTAAHYLKGAFVTDLFACLPFENLETSRRYTFEDMYQVTSTKQFLMLNRLVQMYRMPSALLVLSQYIERRDIVLIIKAIPLYVTLLNILTCFIVFASVNIYYSDNVSWNLVPHNDEGGSWINLFSKSFHFNMTETPWNLHLASFFWVVYEITTTGYNSLYPSNHSIMQILFSGMVIGAMMVTYFMVRIISIRANVNTELAAFQEHMKDFVKFMRRENLDKELQKEVMDYYIYNWDKMGGIDYRNVLKLCDQITLRTDAILHLYGPTFAKCPLLSDCDISVLRILGRAVRSMYFHKHTSLVSESDVIANIYFVDYGSLLVRDPRLNSNKTIVRLKRGSVFGNMEAEPTIRCPVSIQTTSDVHLLQINTKAFHLIISDFPVVTQLIEKYRPNNEVFISAVKHHGDTSSSPWRNRGTSVAIITTSTTSFVKWFHYKNTSVQVYLIIVSLLCVYADVYNATFQDNSLGLILALYALDLAFYLKIVIQYLLPFMERQKDIKIALASMKKRYFKTEFKYDVLSCLPIEVISLFYRSDHWEIFAWLRLNRMLRIVTIYKSLKYHFEKVNINLLLTIVLSVLMWFSLLVHTAACAWYFIAVTEDKMEENSSWLHKADGDWCQNEYVCSLYFILTTFTQNGVGDIMPKKQSEVIFVSLFQIVSTMVYLVYVGEFSNIIQYQSFRSFSFYSKYLELQEFMKNNRVSKNLVHIVNKYSLHLWRESRGKQLPHFLEKAPNCLKLKIMSAVYLKHLTSTVVFQDCEPAFLRQLVGCLQLLTYNADMYVVKESEITDCMYMIHRGRVEELTEGETRPSRVYNTGQSFGMMQGLVRDLPYKYSYRTQIKSQILSLQLDRWEYLLKHFPDSKDTIYRHAKPRGNSPDDDKHNGKEGHKVTIVERGDDQPPTTRIRCVRDEDVSTVSFIDTTSSSGQEISQMSSSSPTPPPVTTIQTESMNTDDFTAFPGPSHKDLMSKSIDKANLNELFLMDNRNISSESVQNISATADIDKGIRLEDLQNIKISQSFKREEVKEQDIDRDQRDEFVSSKVKLLQKIASAAKKFVKKRSEDTTRDPSKDELLMLEEEEATKALVEKIEEATATPLNIEVREEVINAETVDEIDEQNKEQRLYTVDYLTELPEVQDNASITAKPLASIDSEFSNNLKALEIAENEHDGESPLVTQISLAKERHVRYQDASTSASRIQAEDVQHSDNINPADSITMKNLSDSQRDINTLESDVQTSFESQPDSEMKSESDTDL